MQTKYQNKDALDSYEQKSLDPPYERSPNLTMNYHSRVFKATAFNFIPTVISCALETATEG